MHQKYITNFIKLWGQNKHLSENSPTLLSDALSNGIYLAGSSIMQSANTFTSIWKLNFQLFFIISPYFNFITKFFANMSYNCFPPKFKMASNFFWQMCKLSLKKITQSSKWLQYIFTIDNKLMTNITLVSLISWHASLSLTFENKCSQWSWAVKGHLHWWRFFGTKVTATVSHLA